MQEKTYQTKQILTGCRNKNNKQVSTWFHGNFNHIKNWKNATDNVLQNQLLCDLPTQKVYLIALVGTMLNVSPISLFL